MFRHRLTDTTRRLGEFVGQDDLEEVGQVVLGGEGANAGEITRAGFVQSDGVVGMPVPVKQQAKLFLEKRIRPAEKKFRSCSKYSRS